MDRLSAEDYQEVSAEKSLEDTEEFVKFVRGKCVSPSVVAREDGTLGEEPDLVVLSNKSYSTSLVQPIITPRFGESSSSLLLVCDPTAIY